MITLRRVAYEDAVALYAWRQDLESIRFSSSMRSISLEEHVRWFCDRLIIQYWWVGQVDGRPVGAVRIDEATDGRLWVSINMATEARGHGYGTDMLRLLPTGPFDELYARIHRLNAPSLRAFAKAGYSKVRDEGVFEIWRLGLSL